MTNRNLVYYCSFGQSLSNVSQASLALASAISVKAPGTDILLYTNPETFCHIGQALDAEQLRSIKLWLTDEQKSNPISEAAWARYEIFKYSSISEYDIVLYLDIDTITCLSLESLFSSFASSRYLVSCLAEKADRNKLPPNQIFHGQSYFDLLTPPHMPFIPAVSTGAIIFKNCPPVIDLFFLHRKNACRFWQKANEQNLNLASFEYCDQPAFNYTVSYFGWAEYELLSGYVRNNPECSENSEIISVAHFPGGIGNTNKVRKMKSFLQSQLVEKYFTDSQKSAAHSTLRRLRELASSQEAVNKNEGSIGSEAPKTQLSDKDLYKARFRLTRMIQDRVYQQLIAANGPKVTRGPFKSMQYAVDSTWGDPCAKLIGVYEQCLHKTIMEIISQFSGYSVVDLGCAEGYYAAGMALKLGSNSILIADINKASVATCKTLLALNCPNTTVTAISAAEPDFIARYLSTNPQSVIIVDIEGGEVDLFQSNAFTSALEKAPIIVEMHEFIRRDIFDGIRSSIESTHELKIISEQDVDPNSIPEIAHLDGLSRSIALCESRPEPMRWLYAKPRQ